MLESAVEFVQVGVIVRHGRGVERLDQVVGGADAETEGSPEPDEPHQPEQVDDLQLVLRRVGIEPS